MRERLQAYLGHAPASFNWGQRCLFAPHYLSLAKNPASLEQYPLAPDLDATCVRIQIRIWEDRTQHPLHPRRLGIRNVDPRFATAFVRNSGGHKQRGNLATKQQTPAMTEDRLSKATILGMIAMGVAVLVVANDFTALSVALPAIEHDLHTNVTTVQWVINGYAMVFGVLIVTGGRLADMFGRRRIFIAGAAIFAGFSVIGGFAPNAWVLLACRFLMGIGGAMMWPAILGMTYGLLPRAKAGLAGGVILGAAGFGNAVGPLLGGLLTDTVGWRWIFFVNLPVAAAAVLITMLVVPRDAPVRTTDGIDYRGTAALSIGLLALLLALDWALDLGWTAPLIIFLFVLGGSGVGRVPVHRAPRRRQRAGSRNRHAKPGLRRSRYGHAVGLGHLLRRAALSAAVHVRRCSASPRSARARGCCR